MKYVLAPLADFTDAPFRRLCFEAGADMAYTEMVSAAALFHGHRPTRHLMETMPGEGPVACQLFGADEREIAFAARAADALLDDCGGPRFCELNLNAGCPMPRIMATGSGAALVTDPEKVYRLLKAMAENTSLPVTLKTRLGPHRATPTIFELLDAAESAGAKGIVVHARSVGQKHGGPTDLVLLGEVVRRARIPVTGNGSVRDVESARAMEATGVAAVMVGRTALSDPGVFAKLKALPAPAVPWAERHIDLLLEFRRRLAEKFPEDRLQPEDDYVSAKMRTHIFRYFKGVPGASALRARIHAVKTLAEARAVVAEH